MNIEELIVSISQPEFDLDAMTGLAIQDAWVRETIVRQMIAHEHIMVYYHCFSVASKASQERPDLFYPFWYDIVPLLNHANSYHRDFGLTLLANLTAVDRQDRFDAVCATYFAHVNDAKFMTACCCVQNAAKIVRNKPALREDILSILLDVDARCDYPDKQKALLKFNVLEVLDQEYANAADRTRIDRFILAAMDCVSPKTVKKAKEMGNGKRLIG